MLICGGFVYMRFKKLVVRKFQDWPGENVILQLHTFDEH